MAIREYFVRDRDCPAGFKPFLIDTLTGIKYYTKWDDAAQEMEVASVQPIDDILNANQADSYNAKGSFTGKGKWGVLAARVPVQELQHWMTDGNGDEIKDSDERSKIIKRELNDGDNSKFRVAEFNL